jgi:hypothetical protein
VEFRRSSFIVIIKRYYASLCVCQNFQFVYNSCRCKIREFSLWFASYVVNDSGYIRVVYFSMCAACTLTHVCVRAICKKSPFSPILHSTDHKAAKNILMWIMNYALSIDKIKKIIKRHCIFTFVDVKMLLSLLISLFFAYETLWRSLSYIYFPKTHVPRPNV